MSIMGFTMDLRGNRHLESLYNEEGILYAELDVEATFEGKQC